MTDLHTASFELPRFARKVNCLDVTTSATLGCASFVQAMAHLLTDQAKRNTFCSCKTCYVIIAIAVKVSIFMLQLCQC